MDQTVFEEYRMENNKLSATSNTPGTQVLEEILGHEK